METTVNTITYAKKLKARLRELETERKKKVFEHGRAVTRWRREIVAWVKANAPQAGKLIIKEARGSYDDAYGLNFDPKRFFRGAPKAPVLASDEPIRKVRALLRQLSISGQKTMRISTKEVADIFGDGKLDDE